MSALRLAKISSSVVDAALILRRAVGLDTGVAVDLLPSQAEWHRMNDTARMLALGEWLRSACYEQADVAVSAPLVAWEPIGGAKYAHQND